MSETLLTKKDEVATDSRSVILLDTVLLYLDRVNPPRTGNHMSGSEMTNGMFLQTTSMSWLTSTEASSSLDGSSMLVIWASDACGAVGFGKCQTKRVWKSKHENSVLELLIDDMKEDQHHCHWG